MPRLPHILALLALSCAAPDYQRPARSPAKCYETTPVEERCGPVENTQHASDLPTVFPVPETPPVPEFQNDLPDAITPSVPKKTVTLYFDPSCGHCEIYQKNLDASGIPERFSPEYQFSRVCVELPFFGKDGRCELKYGQDGKMNYDTLLQRCQEAQGEYCGSVPSLFVGDRLLSREGMDNLELILQEGKP